MRISAYSLLACMFLAGISVGCGAKTKKKASVNQENTTQATLLNVNDFESKMKSMPNAQIIDVRTPGEFSKGYIQGAININYQGQNFTQEIGQLDKTKPTFVYCQLGGRSEEACHYMVNQGFKELYQLDGGISSWTHYNKPVELTH